MPQPQNPDAFVTDLISDARLIADYGRLSGGFKDDTLFQALADAENLPEKSIGRPEIIRLQRSLNDAAKLVPFTTFVALNRNWSPRRYNRKSTLATYFMVGLSILFMVVTGKLTYVYNRGVEVAQEMAALKNEDIEQRFGETLRQLWVATEKPPILADVAGINSFENEAVFKVRSDLRKIDTRLSNARDASNRFAYQAAYPIWGMRPAYCLYNRLRLYLDAPTNGAQPGKPAQLTPRERVILSVCTPEDGAFVGDSYGFFDKCNPGAFVQQASATPAVSLAGNRTNPIEQFRAASDTFFCDRTITTDPSTISAFASSQANYLKNVLDPYALWILPAIYGALGALMFQMRRILDPLSPNPAFERLIHRVALGSLAGMILAWFVAPETRFGTDTSGIGFGLFSFAFLFGFAIDVFFTVLDEFVSFANATVRKFGSGATAAASMPPQPPSPAPVVAPPAGGQPA